MKIEEGKTYMDGEGTLVGPMRHCRNGGYSFQGFSKNGWRAYTEDGYFDTDKHMCLGNLVGEYKIPTLNLKEGKRYVTRGGDITGPAHDFGYGDWHFGIEVNGVGRLYTSEGINLLSNSKPEFDLLYEYNESDNDCMAYTEQNNDDSSIPLLNIFKPIRTIHANTPAKFLARAEDGSYLIQVGEDWDEVGRFKADELDGIFENIPEPKPTKELIYLCQNSVTGDKYIRSIKPVEDKLLSACELSYSDEDGWQVLDLKGEKCNG